MLLIKNGTIVDPYTDTIEKKDILISDGGIITQISKNISCDCETFDATNLKISPGLIDVHVHFRVPGGEAKETLETGVNSAIRGGFTTVVAMANTNPIIDNKEVATNILNLNAKTNINILQCASVTKGFDGKTLVDMSVLNELGIVGFTDDGVNIKNASTTLKAFEECERLDVPISLHEEENSLIFTAGANDNCDFLNELDLKGASSKSEYCSIARDVSLAIGTKTKVNFQHISTKESVSFIKFGKSQGLNLTAEVTPHHIYFNEDALKKHGTFAKMNPPLRTEQDRLSLIAGLKDGTIDIIATDHAPHTSEEKSRDFVKAPSGIIGLETAFSVSNTALQNDMNLIEILKKMTVNPAKLYNLTKKEIVVGNKAELFIYCEKEDFKYTHFVSKSENSPFKDIELKGKVYATIVGSKILYRG